LRGELGEAKLTQDSEPLVPPYGLLDARFRPICAREGEEEIRCRFWRSLAFPLSFAGDSIGIASECSIVMLELLASAEIASGIVFAILAARRVNISPETSSG